MYFFYEAHLHFLSFLPNPPVPSSCTSDVPRYTLAGVCRARGRRHPSHPARRSRDCARGTPGRRPCAACTGRGGGRGHSDRLASGAAPSWRRQTSPSAFHQPVGEVRSGQVRSTGGKKLVRLVGWLEQGKMSFLI